MHAAQKRRLAAVVLVVLSLFFCRIGDREDNKSKRAEVALPLG